MSLFHLLVLLIDIGIVTIGFDSVPLASSTSLRIFNRVHSGRSAFQSFAHSGDHWLVQLLLVNHGYSQLCELRIEVGPAIGVVGHREWMATWFVDLISAIDLFFIRL